MKLSEFTIKQLEQEIKNRKDGEEQNTYWIVWHGADTNETGLFMNVSYIKAIWKGFTAQRSCEAEIVEDYCYSRFGNKVDYVQGVAPCPGWKLAKAVLYDFQNPIPMKWGGVQTKTHIITLEIGNKGKTEVIDEFKWMEK